VLYYIITTIIFNENPRHGEQEVIFEKAVSIPVLGEPQLITLRW